jgi:undecaprenyl diphosphate synthase
VFLDGFERIRVNMEKPQHIAIIMDGNGRWAQMRGKPRIFGHEAGVEALRKAVRATGNLGIEWLTVYAFSSENWSRPRTEVRDLMGLLKIFVKKDLAELHREGVRVHVIGEREGLEPDIRSLLEEAEKLTSANAKMNVVIAFNYGARDEITRAAVRLAEEVASGGVDTSAVNPDFFAKYLDTSGIPDPDLIIRTGGEKRLSNFLLWQAAYAEFVFFECFWPDFGERELRDAVSVFSARERRFGGLVEKEKAS